MTVKTTIDTDNNLARHMVDGVLTYDEAVEAIEGLFSNPLFSPSMNVLAEIMPGSTAAMSSDDIHRIIQASRKLHNRKGPGKTAIVVSNDEDYGMFHVLEFLLQDEDRELKVFKGLPDAQDWLNH